ncbi:MAG TPA: ATP-binding protein [candidate division Zixibacteria bacterium]|nr:ATP-binding protein [candidate division Zixibacteria bacterium]
MRISSLKSFFSARPGSRPAAVRHWFPTALILFGIGATLTLSRAVGDANRESILRIVEGEVQALSRSIEGAVTAHIESLVRMSHRWGTGKLSRIELETDARTEFAYSYGLEAIEGFDSRLQRQWGVSTGGRKIGDVEAALGPSRDQLLRNALSRQAVTMTRALDQPPGGTAILIYVPVFSPGGDRPQGFIAAVLNPYSTMTGLLNAILVRRYDVEILEGQKRIYIKPGAQATTKEWAREADLKLHGVAWGAPAWTIRVWPTPEWLAEIRSGLDRLVLVTGFVVTALLALLAHVFQIARERARQLEAANEMLRNEIAARERAQSALADFTAMIAHDLRSPLNQVMGVSELMADGVFGPVTDEQKRWLTKSTETARQLVSLVNDFLDLSKLESGRMELALEETEPESMIDRALDTCRLRAREKAIELRKAVDAQLPRLRVDARRLEQVLMNLLDNAVKFTPAGGRIEIGAASRPAEVEFWVRDNGVGIPAEEMSALFEKYRQTASGKASKHKGTGLGLVICKMIVEAHGGRIRAESRPGEGATFSFTVPLGSAAAASEGPPAPARRVS